MSCFPALGLHRLPETKKLWSILSEQPRGCPCTSYPKLTPHYTTTRRETKPRVRYVVPAATMKESLGSCNRHTQRKAASSVLWLTNRPQNDHMAGPSASGRCNNFSKTLFHWNLFLGGMETEVIQRNGFSVFNLLLSKPEETTTESKILALDSALIENFC